MKTFKEKVLQVVKKIPKGKTLSYKEVARRAGSPRASRVVGNIMAWNRDVSVPCHRVINSNGKIGGYNGLRGKKKELLRGEGVKGI
jgi:O-6-methylguanine DNA methyltransferase